MDKIRIGIDIQCEWSITTNGAPLALDGRDLTLVLSTPIGLKRELPFTTEGNVAHFSYHGIDHRQLGKYSVTMWENKGKIGQNAVDKVDAFVLVRSTEEMGVGKPSNLKVVTVNLGTSDMVVQFGNAGSGQSYDDTEIKESIAELNRIKADRDEISDMETKTHASQTYALASSLADFVRKEAGKQLSSNDFTNALKEKLESLKNYDDGALSEQITTLQGQIDTLVGANASAAIESFNEIIAFLDGVEDTQSLSSIIAGLSSAISNVEGKIPTNLSQLSNDSGFITQQALDGYLKEVPQEYVTETELEQKGFAKSSEIPTLLSQLKEDATHRLVTDEEKQKWNTPQPVPEGGTKNYNDLSNKPQIGGVELTGNKTLDELGIQPKGSYANKEDIPSLEGYAKESWVNAQGFDKKIKVVDHAMGDTTFAITPNTLHKWGTVANLTITLAPISDVGVVNEYLFEFVSGEKATTLSLPDSIKWQGGNALKVEANKTYQVSIINNLAVGGAF